MAMKQLTSIFMNGEIWDWTFQCPDVQKVISFNKKISKRVFQELWICVFIIWGGVLPNDPIKKSKFRTFLLFRLC